MGIHKVDADTAVNKRRAALLEQMLKEHKPDFVALQEAPRSEAGQVLRNAGYELDDSRHRLVTAWRVDTWRNTAEQPIAYARASALVLERLDNSGADSRVLLCNLHLPARVPAGSITKTSASLSDLIQELYAFRQQGSTTVSEIVVGDFNLEPYELVVQGASGLYGSRSLKYVWGREKKRLSRERKRALYNPSWRLYGTEDEPHGTAYYMTGDVGEPWFVLDQALFSGDLVTGPASVEVVQNVGGATLLSTKAGLPDEAVGSDHLPLVWMLPTHASDPLRSTTLL